MLNPLTYTEKIVQSFLRYQLSAYPFADERLNQQMRSLLSLDKTRETPLLKGPYVSLSRAFHAGASIDQLVREGILHPHLQQIIPFPAVYGHQEEAIRAISAGRTTLISTGTGSGKSECFLYPIISRCLQLRDEQAPPGICAVIIYPMNALAEDQLGRLRELLAGSGITFGMYVGKTPQKEAEVRGRRLAPGSSNADYRAALQEARQRDEGAGVHPPEEACSREIMRTPGRQPRILLTNVKQLELLLTRQSDVELFDNARLDFLVFDEAHTYTGAQGAETACLVRRLRSFCGRDVEQTVCVATSATIVDASTPDAARDFASRFFGVARDAVATVNEVYEEQVWASPRRVPAAPSNPAERLREVLLAVDAKDADRAVRAAWKKLTGSELPDGPWEAALHDALSGNELLYQVSELLNRPRELRDLLEDLAGRIGRQPAEEELILWLALGAAARKDGRPLIRPVVHAFLRGVPGAIVTFDGEGNEPTLHLSAEDEDDDETRLRLRVSTCTTCGQHYFEHSLADFKYTGKIPGGGMASGEAAYWEPMDEARGGRRLLLVDKLISSEDEELDEEHPRLSPLHLCRTCGAGHAVIGSRCLACGVEGRLLELLAVQQREDRPGKLSTCVCCGSWGRSIGDRFREPNRPVRATNVADVHVLAQDMIHHAERKRLLIFADNRQDAAFQAGWMRDHSRRYRLRALMAREIEDKPLSVGDLTHHLDQLLEKDPALSQVLLPEVWAAHPQEDAGTRHREERQYLLRIHVLREITMAARQQIGLEPWGRLRIKYVGLDEDAFVRRWADRLRQPPDELLGGISALLDHMRRSRLMLDRRREIFTRFWGPGDREILDGYLPDMRGVPKGVKFTRQGDEDGARVTQWVSRTGHQTTQVQLATKWGVEKDQVEAFLRELWDYLGSKDVALLVPVTLKGGRGNALPGCHGVYQIDADRLLLAANKGVYRCRVCRRRTVRRTPGDRCLAWRCDGTLEYVPEDAANYDLQLIDGDYTMIRPREHTAMVPHDEREKIEELFKSESEAINALVCTQTLELGVDIGLLDAVLMRNVPPLPANYWQRAGRAGRRHRMAVNCAYCRSVSHDRAYFAEPLKMLAGRVDPPSFYLANDLMVGKHVRATILTQLYQLGREGSGLSEPDCEEVREALRTAFPPTVRDYLFDDAGHVRDRPLDVRRLHTVITKHEARLGQAVVGAFTQGWPESDAHVATSEKLSGHVQGMVVELEAVIRRLHRRLRWALDQMASLEALRKRVGTLDEEQQAFYKRCDRFVRRLKGMSKRRRSQLEGVDDISTYSVLAREGFLPGYGLEVGSVLGMAEVPHWVRGGGDFDLPRPPSVAIREYVPGNLIYANGQKFVPRRYTREAGEDREEAVVFEVSEERQTVREVAGSAAGDPGAAVVTSIPICDVTLVHISRILDEEDNRFQMGVSIFGREQDRHDGGTAYRWGQRPLHVRKGVHLQLVNVGPTFLIKSRAEFGYAVCHGCGQSVSPFSSERQREDFAAKHLEWCGQRPRRTAFHANLVVDALTLPACESRTEAFSMAEALRFAAADVLDMDQEDLQILVLGRSDSDEVDAALYDPMPGGSGLLEQIVLRFPEIVAAAGRIAEDCPALCEASCIDCFRVYRNAFYHGELNRHVMAERLEEWSDQLVEEHSIPARQPRRRGGGGSEQPVNVAERRLRRMLEAAGFPDGSWQESHPLPKPLNSTAPDVTYRDPDDSDRKICVYLDGLSGHIHGKPETRSLDLQIRAELRGHGHEVIEVTNHDLDDRQAMARHFSRLGRLLEGRDFASRVKDQSAAWFAAGDQEGEPSVEAAAEVEAAAAVAREEAAATGVQRVTGAPAAPATADLAAVGAATKRGEAAGAKAVAAPTSPAAASPAVVGAGGVGKPPFRFVEAADDQRYRTCVPVYDLKAAAGSFSEGQAPEPLGWAELNTRRTLNSTMFVAQVRGRSMEPKIPDGSWCLFTTHVAGSRHGRILLVQHRDIGDPDYGGQFTIKKYDRPPQPAGEGDELTGAILLKPLNPEYEPIRIEDASEEIRVIAELVHVL